MDPLISPRFGRQARYDSFSPPLHFPDPAYHPHRHPPFAPFPPPPIHGNHPLERRRSHYHHPTDDPFFFPFPHRSNPPVFDPLPVPRVPVTHGVFDEGPERFPSFHGNSFHLGDPDPPLVSRLKLEFKQDRFFTEDSEWRHQRHLGFWDDQESRCGDLFLVQLQPETASLATAPPPFSSPRGLRRGGSVHGRGGEASGDFEGGWPCPTSPHFVGNGVNPPHGGHSVCNKINCVRDAPADCGPKGRQYVGHKAIKESDPMDVAGEDGFSSSYNIGRKSPNIASMDYTHDYGEESSIGSKGKRKMVNDGNAKYHARPTKRPMQKPSAFSRIQNGVSVWERLEEKALISPPPCSLPCSLSSPPRISRDDEPKVGTSDLSFKSNSLVAKVVDPLSPEPSCIKKLLPVIKPNRFVKKKKVVPIREKVVVPIVSVSASSRTKRGFQRTSSFSNLESVSERSESSNKAWVPSCRPGSEPVPGSCTKKLKKLVVAKKGGDKAVNKTANQTKGCIIGTPRIEKSVDSFKFEGDIKCAQETKHCAHDVAARTEPIDDRDLHVYQQGQMIRATTANDITAKSIAKYANKEQDIVIDNLYDSGEGPLKLGPTLDNRCGSPVVSDALVIVNVCSQPSGQLLHLSKQSPDNVAAQESFGNVDNNDAANLSNQVKPAAKDFENSSPLKIEQHMPSAAVSPELIGAGEVTVSADPRTPSCSDDSLKCNSLELEIEREGKKQNKMTLTTASEAVEITGTEFSAQSCLQQPQAPSVSELSNAIPTQKLPIEESFGENNECSLPGWILPPESGCNVTFQDSLIPPVVDSCGIRTDQDLPLGLMKMDSQAMHFENALQPHPLSCDNKGFNNNSKCSSNEDKNQRGKGEAFAHSMLSLALEPDNESGRGMEHLQSVFEKTQHFPSDEIRKLVPPIGKLSDEELSCKWTSLHSGVPKFPSSRPNFSSSLNQTGRHRTWLRINTLSSHSDDNLHQPGGNSSIQVPKKLGKVQNSSYIRKGNSLIRKPAAEPPTVLLADVGASSIKSKSITERSKDSESRSECLDNEASFYPVVERPKTPPLPPLPKLSGCMVNSHNGIPQSMPMDTRPELGTDQGSQGLLTSNLEVQDTVGCKRIETINSKRVIYVKRKKNQLVAASGTEVDVSSKLLEERFQKPVQNQSERSKVLPFSSSVLYFRRNRNQLVRNASSSEGQQIRIPAANTDLVGSIQHSNIFPFKKRLDNVHQKAKRPARSSLVWTLGGDKLSQKSMTTLCHQRVLPYIIPWKRAANWKSVVTNDMPISSRSSFSLISRKLQHLRKRDTIYKVSTDGFSLRKAGVVSIGGSNLKWSKSIEKRSKKASEEATMAVAEVERKKREGKKCKSTRGNGKDKAGLPCRSISSMGLKQGERIFRVGSARYKMDSSKRTLIRISDDQSSSLENQQSGNRSRISFVPRRLVIGNNEYIRIGNGNQLVRDPKKLKRILASEKVRWSLHTVRLRLAQKRQHCLFLTRFGKCNNRGKCPYIHDPTKVAICTKFLKGQCSDISCKLTHKVIPERMPDCSYFLKGLCTIIDCPYRHVKVNANAPLCSVFLRGHCADGDECHKKHSYTCLPFEATGKCPQGSFCKLHHPKGQSKSRKRKQAKLQSSSQGRYFYSSICEAGDSLRVALGQNDLEDGDDIFYSNGRFTEFISLDVNIDSVGINNNIPTESYPGQLEYGCCDLQSCDIDALIKPVGIMNRDDLMIF